MKKCVYMLWICTFFVSLAFADVKLPAIFGENMVLQQKSEAAVWGWADAGEKIEIKGSWMDAAVKAEADKDGKWQVKISTPQAGGPYELTVTGKNTVKLGNILSGEVWICSGQSNMQWAVGASNNAKEEIASADFPKIRLFTVERVFNSKPQQDCKGSWKPCSPETAGAFSAAGYFFGRELHQQLNIPIGLISTNWGGTPAEAWTSEESLKQLGGYDEIIKQFQNPAEAPGRPDEKTQKAAADWEEKIAAMDLGITENWKDPKLDVSDWKEMEQPKPWTGTDLENVDGIVWFRRVTNLPPSWTKAPLELHLGTIDDIDTVWFNGVKLGTTIGWDKSRKYLIPATALRVGPNVIAVRIIDISGEGGFGGSEEQMRIGPVGADTKTCATIARTWKYKVSVMDKPIPEAPEVKEKKLSARTPTALYNGMIAPLIPFRIAGAIWYQGESNVGRPAEYAKLFPAMIADWRKHWNIGDFPFYWVQIAPYKYSGSEKSESAYLREAQLKSLFTVNNSGMAVTMDIGVENDIHPKNKQDVGKRLALWALAKTYNKKLAAFSGPVYKSMKIDGQKVILSFDNTNGGLSAREGQLSDFIIAGEDKKFVPAQAKIDGTMVVVFSDQIQNPIAVRYAWKNWAAGSLFNGDGLPASSFRTDDWNDNPDGKIVINNYMN